MKTTAYRVLSYFVSAVAVSGALIAGAQNSATGTEIHSLRDILYVTVRSDPESPLLSQGSGNSPSAKLTVKVRISAHSQETNFYGDVPAVISDFDPSKGSRELEIWRDAKCHHERGYPKLSVISVDGHIENGQKKLPIAARYRWVGLLLPGDEIMPAKPITRGMDDVGPFIATRTETKKSHLFVDLKLYMLPCSLSADAQQ